MARACLQIPGRVFSGHSAADLHPSRICRECPERLLPCSFIIPGSRMVEENNMPSCEMILSVHFRVIISPQLRGKICGGKISVILETASHDLLYFSVMYVNTWPELHLPRLPYLRLIHSCLCPFPLPAPSGRTAGTAACIGNSVSAAARSVFFL